VPTLRKAVLLERAVFSRGVPANLPSRRMGATGCFVAIWRMEIGELAVDHAVADGRKVGGGPKAPSVSTSADYPSQEPTSGSSCGYRMGLAALGRARIPVDTRGCPTARDRYRSKTGAASRWSCLASLSSCEGVATLALAENQCGKLYSRWNPDMLCSKECIVRPLMG